MQGPLRIDRSLVLIAYLLATVSVSITTYGGITPHGFGWAVIWGLLGAPGVGLMLVPLLDRLQRRPPVSRGFLTLLAACGVGLFTPLVWSAVTYLFFPLFAVVLLLSAPMVGLPVGLATGVLLILLPLLRGLLSPPSQARPARARPVAPALPAGRCRGGTGAGLVVLYDPSSDRAAEVARWVIWQRAFMPLEVLPAASPAARRRLPQLDHDSARYALHVVAGDGRFWRGAAAWVVLAWALMPTRERALALHARGEELLARPLIEGLAQAAFGWQNSRRLASAGVAGGS